MAEVHGKGGSITFTNLTAGVTSFTVDYEGDVVETTDFADAGVKTWIAGGKGWTVSAEGNWDAANTATVGDSASFTGTADTGDTYAGTAILTGLSVKVDKADVNKVSYKFQGTGTLTITL